MNCIYPTSRCIRTPDGNVSGNRGNWTNKAEYLLSMIGYAVGLGNVWRFPYLAFENGGGAFLVPYLIMLVLAGLPIFFLEVALGQFSSQGPLGAFNCIPIFKGLGITMVIVSGYVGIYYNVLITYALFYLISSFTNQLPWAKCNQLWNTSCVDMMDTANNSCLNQVTATTTVINEISSISHADSTVAGQTFCFNRSSPSEDYWKFGVLELTESVDNLGRLKWELALVLLLAWVIIFLCLIKGVKSSGKAVYFTATFPYVVLTALLIRGVTLDGAADGIKFFFKPKWEKLKEAKVWRDAATQIFYSLSASWGGLITLSSYNKFDNNCYRDSFIVVATNSFTSIFAGTTIFAVIGYMSHVLKTDISNVAADGPGLAFVVYPEALSKMSLAPLWSVIFFLMLVALGLGTMFATLETIVTSLTDAFPAQLRHKKTAVTFVVCSCLALLGMPLTMQGGFYLLHILDTFAAPYSLMICAIIETLSISYLYVCGCEWSLDLQYLWTSDFILTIMIRLNGVTGLNRFCKDIEMMTNVSPNWYWKVTWSLVSPGVLTFIFIYSLISHRPLRLDEYEFPLWANVVGWLTFISGAMFIPMVALYQVWKQDGNIFQRVRKSCKPEATWGPYLEADRKGIYAKDLSASTNKNIAWS